MKLTTTIDVTLGRGQNMREHYRVRANRVKEEREATGKALLSTQFAGDVRWEFLRGEVGARVTLMRPIARIPLDTDNLSGAFKGVRDEVAAFLGVDDRSDRIHWVYTQEKGKGLKPTITIEVMPVADIDPQAKRVRELEDVLRRFVPLCEHGVSGALWSLRDEAVGLLEGITAEEARRIDNEKRHAARLLGMVTT
jgi:hypothetical protein